LRSSAWRVRSGLELLLVALRAGVWEREATVRDEAVSARPRVWLGSREADEGLSIWCDTFPAAGRACRRGKAAAWARHRGQHSSEAARRSVDVEARRLRAQQQPALSHPRRVGSVFHGTWHRLEAAMRRTQGKSYSHMPQTCRAASSVAGGESCSPSNKAQDVEGAVERVATAVMDGQRWNLDAMAVLPMPCA
jgi:hypothetical protein